MSNTQHLVELADKLYERISRRPRSLVACGAGLGVALSVAVTAGRLPTASRHTPSGSSSAAATTAPTAVATAPAAVGQAASAEPLAVVGAYNAASIAAAATGDVSLVLPFFADGSREPEAIDAEFARRAARGEQHRSSLVRWGVAEQQIFESSASIVTQEVWDDQIFRDGERIDSRYGTIMRIRYSLERAAPSAPWRIQTIHSTVVVP